MPFIDLDSLKSKEVFKGGRIRVASGERIMLSLLELDPNAVVPPHSHPHEQAGIVLEGEFELTIGDEKKLVKKGDTYIAPPGVEHSVIVPNAPAKVLDVFSPPREDYKNPSEDTNERVCGDLYPHAPCKMGRYVTCLM